MSARAPRGGAGRSLPFLFAVVAAVFAAPGARAGDSLQVIDRLLDDSCSGPRPAGAVIDVVVIHFSSNVVAKRGDPFHVEDVLALFQRHHVSAHYLIARNGRVYRLVDESRRAFHAGRGIFPYDRTRDDRLNDTSIGIELLAVGSEGDMRPFLSRGEYARVPAQYVGFTRQQYASLLRLLGDLRTRHPKLTLDRRHVIGHDQYAPGRKTDPGELFRWNLLGLDR